MKTEKIFVVSTEGDGEGMAALVLGYAVGSKEDIEKYYEDRKAYRIYLEERSLMYITPESVNERKELLRRKKQIEEEKRNADKQLNEIDGILRA